MQPIALALMGAAAGLLSGLLGVGGGIIIVPALAFLTRMEMKLAIGTSLAVIVPTAVVGVIEHAQAHRVDWRAAGLVAVGAIIAAHFAPRLVDVVPTLWLKRIFALLLIFTAVRLLTSSR